MTLEGKNTYYLALYRKHWATPGLYVLWATVGWFREAFLLKPSSEQHQFTLADMKLES